MSDYKIIHDTIYGSIKLSGLLLEVLEAPEVQKLAGIHQLGLAYLVFPGANHTRLEHSLGTSYIAGRIVRELDLTKEEQDLVRCSALLHDVGHGPYSHTLEMMVHAKTGQSHVELTSEIIRGKLDIMTESDNKILTERKPLHELIQSHGLDPTEVASLITSSPGDDGTVPLEDFNGEGSQKFFNPKVYLNQIIHGEIDADQIDYLLRDSHYTGIAHGIIDMDRLIQTMEIYNNDLVLHRRGLSAVEGMLVARSLMYSSIYFHKTVRIAELMLARAVENAWEASEHPLLYQMMDSDLMAYLDNLEGYPQEIVRKLRYRKLFKKILSVSTPQLEDRQTEVVLELSDWSKLREREKELCTQLGIPEGHVLIDIPKTELQVSEPRIKRTQVKIREGESLKPLSKYTPLAKALQVRSIPDWELMVAVDPAHFDGDSKTIEKFMFN
jgi:HD superfamily phosphohydrolase